MVPLRLRSRQWIVDEKGNIIFGEGRSKILETIEKTGSINKTAKILKMSYKGVWSKIRASEEHLKAKIISTDKKEGTKLTKEGKELLEKYRILKSQCLAEEDRIFKEVFEIK